MGETSVRGGRLLDKRGPRKQLEQKIYDVHVKMEKVTLHREDETKDFQVLIAGQDAEDFDESILGIRMILIDFLNLDSLLSVYKPMTWEDSSLLICFLSVCILASIAFMNLPASPAPPATPLPPATPVPPEAPMISTVTGVIAENALEEDRTGAIEHATSKQVN